MTQPADEDRNRWDAAAYDTDVSFVTEYGGDLLPLLDPAPGERILDVGCGTGHLTAEIADAGAAVVGVDAAADMIAAARREYPDLSFRQVDARELDRATETVLAEPFDAVFSNAALHWIREQDRALSAIAAVLRPGGRFVAEFGGAGNVAAIVEATRAELAARGYDGENPWYFPTIGEHASRLESAGFEVRHATLFDRPTPLDGGPDGLVNWLAAFGDGLLSPAPAEQREAIMDAVADRLREERFDEEDRMWTADYRRLRFLAVRSE
ncbi:class I SAM-dependent methyltransferase [Halorubrum vacuolatum]|uniref:Trans-aconitate methyltransferase n=1 Tax=Halorubrum vacuolatum TaxID=63740 RepID=A0A238X7J4_HALVU|nr:class I SAM-dependent methyltransferase [Halorubrum vacuolatum]SNR54592.1 Trans-aconitate methyltransferase [Halorubrum vacuolatum]